MNFRKRNLKHLLQRVLTRQRSYLNRWPRFYRDLVLRVTIKWTPRRCKTFHADYDEELNEIRVNRVHGVTPDWVLELLIWHEVVHVRFPNHDAIFRAWERCYPRAREGWAFLQRNDTLELSRFECPECHRVFDEQENFVRAYSYRTRLCKECRTRG